MKALFKHSSGRLKTSRIAFLVFFVLLVCLSFAYKMGKSADKVLVKIEHVFEAEKKEEKLKEPIAGVNKTLEYPVPDEKSEIKQESQKISHAEPKEKPAPMKAGKQAPVRVAQPVEYKVDNSVQKPGSKIKTEPKAKPQSEKKPVPKIIAEHMANHTPVENQAFEKVDNNKPKTPEKDQVRFTMAQALKVDLNKESMKTKNEKQETLKLSSKEYFEVYKQWQEQGGTLDKEKALVSLRILNLENVYDLFQMKAVVIKEGVPHTDLEDNSRVANASLSEFSSTCFVVSNPWGKWGHALKEAGFREKDNIEVWYYTYEFVRNSIYARALKAFEWSVEKQNLPKDTDPSTADVLGTVYAVNKDGGGSFGVFVPKRIDFKSKLSVDIDPLACFKGQKDIEALNRAGLL